MHLSKLEAFGFKSFADRTTFDLAPGLTGIVGPNGCGKSNVVDAIRWVLGEQSAKSLRGAEMMDVIFNGAGTRKPLGMAEVSLTFSDVQGTLRVEQDEVSITRRLFRSGESEYLINKQPCRLKDIREMFMDTGIGKESYSVIEQGKIDSLLQANAQQRRLIFEEAAGISRYKAKRKETERRLERIDGNLQRLCDIIEEVEKQIRSVKAQASRARRYAELLEEWKRRRLSLAGARRKALRVDEERIAERLGSLREEEAIAGARLSALEADLSTAEVELSGIEDQLLQVRGDAARVESRIASEQERSEMERERSSRLDEEVERLLGQAEQHKLRIGQNIRDLRAKRKHLEEAEAEARRVEEQIRSGSAQEEELGQQERRIRSEEDERRIRHHDALTQRAHAQNRRDALESNLERIVQKLGRLEEESARISEEKEALGDRRTEEAADRQTALDDVGRRRIFLQARTSYRQRLESSQKLREQKMTGLERRKAAVESGLEVLQGIRSEMDGIQEGVKSLLSINGNGGFPGLGKMIADCIDVDLKYANALEAALGGQAQAILAEATGSAIDAIQYLKSEEKGRASLLPLDLPDRNGTRPPLQGPGLVGLASSLVRAPDSLRPMVESLLGHTWVVENLEVALRLSRNGGSGETFVTLDGDRIDSKGFISGGRGDRSSGLIVNRSQFRSLEEEQELLDERAASIRGLQEEAEERLDSISRKISGEQSKIDEGEGIVADAVEELRRLDQSLALLDERFSMGRLEVSELRRQRAATEAEHADAVEEAARSVLEARSLEQEVEGAAQEAKEVRSRREALAAEMTRLQVTDGRVREKLDGLRAARTELSRNLWEHWESRKTAREGTSVARTQSAEAKVAARDAEHRLAGLVEKGEVLRADEVRLKESRDEKSGSIQTLRDHVRQGSERLGSVKDEIQSTLLEENQTTLRLESLINQAMEEFGASIDNLPEPPDEWSEEEERTLIGDLKGKIDRMGNVNLEAVDQLEELQERETFLTGQRDDLQRAKRSLQEAMRRISRTCKEMFTETFDAVREQFQDVFRQLFGGGRADIFLEESEDEAEPGVQIMARPPGKEPRSITLLSGGEKTLTTIALLFAIFRSRPSPFCILDEVDAALDESNINRFVMMLKEFLSESQFLIITHSKPTMAVCDALYGVTQEEQGVTKRVHIRFEEIDRQVA